MEPLGAMSEGEWRSLSGMCSTDEEDAFMAQLLGNCSLPNELRNISNFGVSSSYWTGHESTTNMGGGREVSVFSSNDTNNSMYGGGSGFHCPVSSQEGYYPCHSKPILMRNDSSITMEYGLVDGQSLGSSSHDVFPYNQVEAADFLSQDVSNDSMEFDEHIPESVLDGQGLQLGRRDYDEFPQDKIDDGPSDSSKKRSRLQGHGHVPKSKRSPKLQRDSKTGEMDRKNKAVLQRQNSMISCCSEDESNVSHELNGRKTRASRGSATDPQSLYARKRRERINERLKTLQCLIPNGTKVDISTMLEEAVLYVKFLQLQIKLLSSDDHWMYAPIAYNGMDIGLDLRIGLPK